MKIKLYILLVLILSTVITTGWFVLMVKASTISQPRAVTEPMHGRCADMPRGSQVTENMRLSCFNELYGDGRVSLW